MKLNSTCLIVEDEAFYSTLFVEIASPLFENVIHFRSFTEALNYMKKDKINISFLLLDVRVVNDRFRYTDVLTKGLFLNPNLQFIVTTLYDADRTEKELVSISEKFRNNFVEKDENLKNTLQVKLAEIIAKIRN